MQKTVKQPKQVMLTTKAHKARAEALADIIYKLERAHRVRDEATRDKLESELYYSYGMVPQYNV